MNILINALGGAAVPPDGYGGIERDNAFLVKGLISLGITPKLICRTGSTIRCEKLTLDFSSNEAHMKYVVHAAEKEWGEFDIIHDNACTGLIHKLFKETKPTLWTIHGIASYDNLCIYLSKASMLASIAGKGEVLLQNVILSDVLPVIPLGIDLSVYPFTQQKDDFILFIGVGREDKKYLHYLPLIAKHHNVNAVAIIPESTCDAEYIQRCQDIHPFTVVGELDDIGKLEYMTKAKALVHCSAITDTWQDASPMIVLESLAVGTPVIGNYSGGIPEMIIDGETGFLVHSEQEAIEAYAKIDTIKPLACRQYMEECRTHTIFAQHHLDLYNKLKNLPYLERVDANIIEAQRGN